MLFFPISLSSPLYYTKSNLTSFSTILSKTLRLMGVTRVVKKAGSGATPKPNDLVTVHCTGYLADGKKFWSTHDDNNPFSFNVGIGQVIRGWDEGVLQMQLGETAELLMTSDFAYGPRGFPAWKIPGDASLLFEVELLKIGK